MTDAPANTTQTQTQARTLSRFIEAQRRDGPLLLWALVVGALAGLVGGGFRLTVQTLVGWRTRFDAGEFTQGVPHVWEAVAVSALLAATAVWMVRRFAPEAAGSGVQEVEGALDGLRPVRWRRLLPVKFVAGALSIGSGMILGREGPTIQMGGALGRMMADKLRLSVEHAHVLLAAGSGAGLTAAFNAPLAGMLFVIEEMRPQFHYNVISVQAVLVACAVADVMVRVVLGDSVVLPMLSFATPAVSALWIFPIFGALLGLTGFVFNFALIRMVDGTASLGDRARVVMAAGVGGLVGWLALVLPEAVGGGEAMIERALDGAIPVALLLLLFLGRFALTVVSYGTGAPGGIFAPMLALGTLFGLWFGHLSHGLFPDLIDHPQVFTVAAMGALFSATVRAPITGIVLAMELTGAYQQLLPLILTCVPATLVAHGLGGMPIYTLLLGRVLRNADLGVTGRLVFYCKQDCPLCEKGHAVVAALAERFGLELVPTDVGPDAELLERHGERLPVVEFEGIELGCGRLSERDLERELRRAAALLEARAPHAER
ncbi:H(+)/Cl(-) exchange transporter ClcA [Myxococcota bacterium]|nr:H(+)/Cl(-) exchange transporter ClcA [Myxococcota bacterium]